MGGRVAHAHPGVKLLLLQRRVINGHFSSCLSAMLIHACMRFRAARGHTSPVLQLTLPRISRVCSHKRSLCVTSLMDMGFDPDLAMAAAASTGCDLSAAAAALMEGTLGSGTKPVSVTG